MDIGEPQGREKSDWHNVIIVNKRRKATTKMTKA